MNENPYAAPADAPPPMPGVAPQQAAGAPQPWEVGEVLSLSWTQFKPHWVTLVFSMFLGGVIASVPRLVPQTMIQSGAIDPQDLKSVGIVTGIFSVIGIIVQMFFQVGWIKMWLATARGQTPNFNDMFSGASRYLPLLGMMFLNLVICFVGYIALIVPGVILGIGLSLAQFYVVDQNMGAVDSLKASWAATKGHKGKIFLFGLASALMIMGGYLACCVGAFVAIPVVSVAFAQLYLRLSGTGPALDSSGLPPGGYGDSAAQYGSGTQPPGGFGGPPV